MNKFAAILGLAVIGTVAAFLVFNTPSKASFQATANLQTLFDEWKVKYNKTFGGPENMVRFSIFSANYYQVQARNQEQDSYSLSLNQFADLTQEEFSSIYLGYKAAMKTSSNVAATPSTDSVPSSIDWVTKGAVTGVKNQGQCGSCWAFSTTGSLEGLHYLKTGTLTSFSEQQLVDCSGSYGNMGCNGGLMDNAFKYVEKYGIETEQDYPYEGVDGSCRYDQSKVAFKITGYSDVTHDSVDSLKAAVAQQPTSIAVEADQLAFQFYTGGVITSGCGTSLDHGVLAVGYDASASTPYWLVKNSWGPSWGLNGYLKIAMGTQDGGAGECGIMLSPSIPTDN